MSKEEKILTELVKELYEKVQNLESKVEFILDKHGLQKEDWQELNNKEQSNRIHREMEFKRLAL